MNIHSRLIFELYGFVPRVSLRVFVVIVAGLFSGAAVSGGTLALMDSMALLEAVESAEKATLFVQTPTQVRRQQPPSLFFATAHRTSRCLVFGQAARPAHRGHRLSASLLAPLRC